MKLQADWKNFRRILSYLKPWRLRYAAGLMVCGTDQYVQKALLGLITGDLLAAAQLGRTGDIGKIALSRLLLLTGYLLVAALGKSAYRSAGRRATAEMRCGLYERMLSAPSGGGSALHSGELLARLDNDVSYAGNLYDNAILQPVSTVLSLALGLVTVWSISWKTALALTGLGVLMLLVNVLFVDPGRKRYAVRSQSMAGAMTNMSDLLSGAETVRIYHNQSGLLRRYTDSCAELFRRSMSAFRLRTFQNTLGQVQAALTLAASVGLGFWLFWSGEIGLADMPMLWWIGGLVVSPLSGIGNFLGQIQKQLAGAGRVVEFLDLPAETAVRPGRGRFSKVEGAPAVEAADVSLRLGEKTIFSGRSFTVREGALFVLAGRSGSGKSSFLRILMGFEDYGGSLRLFGRELRELSLAELRAQTSFVPQDALLFDDTIRGNIRMGRLTATDGEVERAARAAGLQSFLDSLPQGLDTPVGERGGQLSGGQKQRVAIARALLKDAPVLLLDEPTSALDSLTEHELIETLKGLRGTRTIVVVTHNPVLVESADGYALFSQDGPRGERN